MAVVASRKSRMIPGHRLNAEMRQRLLHDPALASALLQRLLTVPQFQEVFKNHRSLKPRMDLYDDPASPLVTAVLEVPGLQRDEISIQLEHESLCVRAERRPYTPKVLDATARGAHRLRELPSNLPPTVRETQHGKLRRIIQVPQGLKVEDVQVALADGMLSLSWPRVPPGAEHATHDSCPLHEVDNNVPRNDN